jgi:alpha-glucosidase
VRSLASLAVISALLLPACGGDDEEEPKSEPTFPEKDWQAESTALLTGPDWYRHAVVYEVYVRSFQDSDGDGIGDLPGLTSRLDELQELGVDALWLMPIMPTAFKDSGYDVSDYEDVNPDYGTLADFDALLTAAHDRNMRVIIDLVLNHTSDQHAWFVESRADQTNPKADWYVWSDTPSDPNNGCTTDSPIFGDEPWTLDPVRGQYFFHRFYPEQPDLNYRNPEVVAAALDVARFWLDRGVDGFRCDVIELLVESATDCGFLDETKDIVRQLRTVLDGYDERVMVAEPSNLSDASPLFGNGNDMFHMAFHFGYGYFWGFPFGSGSANGITQTFQSSLDTYPAGAQDALVIGSHDVPRAYATALGDETKTRRAAAIQLTVAGTPFIYYGDELGLRPGTTEVVDSRDAARTPMLWSKEAGFGFSNATPWIPFGPDAELTNLEVERADPNSTYEFYRTLLELRRGRKVWGTGTFTLLDTGSEQVFAFLREDDFMGYVVAINMTEEAQKVSVQSESFVGPAGRVFGVGSLATAGQTATLSLPANGYGVFRFR